MGGEKIWRGREGGREGGRKGEIKISIKQENGLGKVGKTGLTGCRVVCTWPVGGGAALKL